MRATMMLADHCQVADGKLFISGGGWTTCNPGTTPCAVAIVFHVPWAETGRRVTFTLRLVDEDGKDVLQPGPDGEVPVGANGQFEATRPEGPGDEVNVPVSFNAVLRLPPSGRFGWLLEVNEQDSWQLSFQTRPER